MILGQALFIKRFIRFNRQKGGNMFNNLYEIISSGILKDSTTIHIRKYISGMGVVNVASGNWYHDNILDHLHDTIEDFKVFPKDDEIYINLGKSEKGVAA